MKISVYHAERFAAFELQICIPDPCAKDRNLIRCQHFLIPYSRKDVLLGLFADLKRLPIFPEVQKPPLWQRVRGVWK